MNIAMWSGPRNLSTALMYAFAARDDCEVWDEPFYAAYLAKTGLQHPMRGRIIAEGLTDAAEVAALCAAKAPTKPLFYQKHMCQHMVRGVPRNWMANVTNVFLIRHPARVLASFAAKYEAAGLEDIGFVQQVELFDLIVSEGNSVPIVLDSKDIRDDPEKFLAKLCKSLGVDFQQSMLTWEQGPKPYDGVWAAHWYGSVHHSTGFAGPEGDLPILSGAYADVADAAMPYYDRLKAYALR
ncbi:sulfotransferase-like domain-containing protein [Roseivivax sp. CAU 1753]